MASTVQRKQSQQVAAEGASRTQLLGQREVMSRRRHPPIFAVVIIGAFLILALVGPWIAPHSPYAQALPKRLLPPFWLEGANPDFLLGTDKLGRDILSRIIFGSRIALEVAFAGIVVGGGVGGTLGLIAGYKGGKIDGIIMRVVDGTISFPTILLALLLVVTVGAGLGTVVVAIGIVIWAQFARVVRGEALSIRERDWVLQARINGSSDVRTIFAHVFPHVLNTWIVMASLQLGFIILFEAGLSFLGAGIPPPTPAWGQMVADGRDLLSQAWWVAIVPAVPIMLLVLAFNMLGDWLREVLDPKLKQV